MGLGLIFGALSGAGDAAGKSLAETQKFQDEESLMQERANLETEKAQVLAKYNNDLQNAPANRAGTFIAEAGQQDIPVVNPATSVGSTKPGMVAAPVPASTSTDGTWNDINASSKAGQPARNVAQLAMLQNELATEKDPSNIAALKREIDKVSATVPEADPFKPAIQDTQEAAVTTSPDQPAQTRKAQGKEAFQIAYENALAKGDLAAAAQIKAMIPEKTEIIPDGAAVRDKTTGQILFQNAGKEERQDKQIAAQMELERTKEANLNARKERELDPLGLNGSHSLDVAKPIGGSMGTTNAEAQLSTAAQAIKDGLHGDEFLAAVPKTVSAQVKALADGKMAFPAGFAMKTPYWQQMMSLVSQYDPSFDQVNFNTRASTRKAFTSGKEAQSVNALNTVMGHLDSLGQAADALNNTSVPLWNSVTNYVSSGTGDARVKKFEATKKAVVDELTRAWRGSGGSEGDIKTWSSTLDAANSPDQLHGVIGQLGELLESKIGALNDQYNKGMGTAAGGLNLMSPHAAETLRNIKKRAGMLSQDDAGTAQASPSSGGALTYDPSTGTFH